MTKNEFVIAFAFSVLPMHFAKAMSKCQAYPGNPNQLAVAAMKDYQFNDPKADKTLKYDAGPGPYDPTILRAVLNNECTLKELNQIIAKLSVCIIRTGKGSESITLRVPDQGSHEVLQGLVKKLQSEKCFKAVLIPYIPQPN